MKRSIISFKKTTDIFDQYSSVNDGYKLFEFEIDFRLTYFKVALNSSSIFKCKLKPADFSV